MKRLIYLSLFASIMVFAGCGKKGGTDPTPTPTPEPAPTMNYVKFTLNGPGVSNKTFLYSKAKNYVQSYEYSETTSGVIYAVLDMTDKNAGDTTIQLRFDDKIVGNKPFKTSEVFFKMINNKTGFMSSSTIGSFQISSFTPTQLTVNGTSGTKKGKFAITATFSGTLEEDNTGETYTITNGEVKFDGN